MNKILDLDWDWLAATTSLVHHRHIATAEASMQAHGIEQGPRAIPRKPRVKPQTIVELGEQTGHDLIKIDLGSRGAIYQCRDCLCTVGASKARRWLRTSPQCPGFLQVVVSPTAWRRPSSSSTLMIGTRPVHGSHQLYTRGIFVWCASCAAYNRIAHDRKGHGMALVKPCTNTTSRGGKYALSRILRGVPPVQGVTSWGDEASADEADAADAAVAAED